MNNVYLLKQYCDKRLMALSFSRRHNAFAWMSTLFIHRQHTQASHLGTIDPCLSNDCCLSSTKLLPLCAGSLALLVCSLAWHRLPSGGTTGGLYSGVGGLWRHSPPPRHLTVAHSTSGPPPGETGGNPPTRSLYNIIMTKYKLRIFYTWYFFINMIPN